MADFNTTQTAFDLFKAYGLNFTSYIRHPTEINAHFEALKELFETDDAGLRAISEVRDKAALKNLKREADAWLIEGINAIPADELPAIRTKDLPAAPDEFYKPRRTSTSHKWPE